MREILFRGKKLCRPWDADYGVWLYGDLWQEGEEYRICHDGMTDTVFAETVGQYTGTKDKNGNKVFEGDIVRDFAGKLCKIKWSEEEARFEMDYGDMQCDLSQWDAERAELVDNIC